MNERFARFAHRASQAAGSPWAFSIALGAVVVWLTVGFKVGFTDTFYQLLINTGTTIVTFLMVFLIQNTQNRNEAALQKKLDELIRSSENARNELIGIERPERREPP